jgi:hypothetical protein
MMGQIMKTLSGKIVAEPIIKRYMLAPVVFAILAVLTQNVYGHAWCWNRGVACQSCAEATVPGQADVDNSGIVIGCVSAAAAGPLNGPSGSSAFANASTKCLFGVKAKVSAANGGSAGHEQLSLNAIAPLMLMVTGEMGGEFDCDGQITGNIITLSGTASYHSATFMELCVLDINNLSDTQISNIFLTYGSVESAVDANYIPSSRVLFAVRGSGFPVGNFNYNVNIGALDQSKVVVSGVGHIATGIPTVSQWGLIILTILLLTAGAVVIVRRRHVTA